jgi:hypothetical protein
MSLLDNLMGNSSELSPAQAQKEFATLLGEGERIERAYKLVRDHVLFTSHRIIFIDRPGASGAKIDYHSVPYRSITRFSVEAGSAFDPDGDLRIWVAGMADPIDKQFTRQLDVYEIQALLAACVAR